ncbi:MAG: tripartite tricarboxylate transporter substrate binding protein [Polaromonas sp.]|nr:tripartite tricarboxylate transporter substrate binding protein [Polaromonas sp.]
MVFSCKADRPATAAAAGFSGAQQPLGKTRRRLGAQALVLAGAAALLAAAGHASAAYPERAVKIIVPFTAGGATDIVGRIVAEELGKELGGNAFVENREGAAGVIGVQAATRAAPDGYTLLVTANSAVTSHKTLYKNLPYDPLKDLDPVARISAGSHIIVVKASSPFRDVKDLLKAAAAKPGAITYGSGGNGSSVHLAAELLQVQSGVNLLHVPYRGTSLAVTGLLAGDTDVMFDTTPSSYPRIKSGQLRALGVTSLTRAAELPDVPTVAEQGLPKYEVLLWLGLYAPKGLPADIQRRLEGAMQKLLATDRVKKLLGDLGMQSYYASGADLGKQVARETAEWAEVIQKAGVKLD